MTQACLIHQHQQTIIHVDAELRDLIPGFLIRQGKHATAMAEALTYRDFDFIQTLGHKIKGTCGGYGFDALSDLGRAIDQAATRHDPEQLEALLNQLQIYLERVEVVYE